MKKEKGQRGEIVIYERKDGVHFDVTLQDETIWLSQNQIASIFVVKKAAISKHIKNIYQDGELERKSTVSKMETVQQEGARLIKRSVEYYNLDMIIAVGYRVNSKRATQFRIWATGILRNHTLKGYTINERRLKESQALKLKELEKTVSLLQGIMRSKALSESEAKGLLSVVTDYANSWILFQQYDTGSLEIKKKITRGISYIGYEQAHDAVWALKEHLLRKKEGSDVFGVERQKGALEGILDSIRQSFGGKEIYPSLEEKAAHLLYFIIKQHPLVDGNKRVASLLFIFFLSRNHYLYRKNTERKINDNALVALALLIAESKPSEKEVMISLVTNLLTSE